MSYVILEKNGQSGPEIFNKKEAQDKVNEGYTVKINKAGWDLSKKVEKKSVKKKSKKSK